MYDLEKSDAIICNKKAQNMLKYIKENDSLFLQRLNNTTPNNLRNFDREFGLFTDNMNPKKHICNKAINTRGGNAVFCDLKGEELVGGYANYTMYHLNEYLMVPCKQNTWRNHVSCDENKCCSILHQMYDNVTKRK